MDKETYYGVSEDTVTITLDAYNTTTIDSVNWSDANNAVFSIDGITLDSSYVEFEDTTEGYKRAKSILEAPENATKEEPPEVPEGYTLTWNGSLILEELPPPPVLTASEKLAQSGLTVEELKELLGLT